MFALGYEKKKKNQNKKQQKWSVQCIGVVSHVASIRIRTHVAWIGGLELELLLPLSWILACLDLLQCLLWCVSFNAWPPRTALY